MELHDLTQSVKLFLRQPLAVLFAPIDPGKRRSHPYYLFIDIAGAMAGTRRSRIREPCAKCIFVKISLPRSLARPNINRFASAPFDTPLPPCSKRAPHSRIGREGLHPAPGHIDKSAVVRDAAMPEQPRQERQRVIGKRRIHERLLAFQRFRCAATRLPIVVERRFHQLREQLADGA